MQTKFLRTVFLLTAIALLLSVPSFADTQTLQTQEPECLDAALAEPGIETMASSSSNPFKAYLGVASISYGAPDPSTGYVQETVAANTNIWIVEKVLCSYNNKYYYYAGYTYNSQSHRGYFCEDNVYYNGAKLSHNNITVESKPANLKAHTSLAGTVYDGPGTSYATMGSVGQETIKLIRTEGDYNFIEYTVSSNNKTKRGYLHYSKITGSWANLTAQIASRLNGKTLYLKNRGSGQYLDVISWSTAENGRMQQYAFSGDPNQIFKFTYNSAGKYFTIQPANNYTSGRRLAINQASGTQHADKHLAIKTAAENTSQRFWIVEVGANEPDGPHGYKILPISGYGTMTLANRSGYINQYYTSLTNFSDTWIMESTEISTTANHFEQQNTNWCWLASAQCMSSCESGFYLMSGVEDVDENEDENEDED
ncbi:MAG: RICIN domain-containing protein, partial [Clostridia bacterium]|nr:RICIN domain-containing protein [Clostridia bacterium]